MSNNDGDSYFIDSAVSRGRYYIGWTDDSPGNFDLFFGRTMRDSPSEPPAFPTIDRSEVEKITKDAITEDAYGLRIALVYNEVGFDGGVPPVGGDGEGPEPDPIAILMGSDIEAWHNRIILCGPDSVCIEDAYGGGLIGGADEYSSLYQFYPLNEESWNVGDSVSIWILLSSYENGTPKDDLHWVNLGEHIIENCESDLWC